MTAEEQITRITRLFVNLDLDYMCYEEYEVEFMKQSVNDIKDEMWRLYCFANDVFDTLNM
jgi:hypothetical protein